MATKKVETDLQVNGNLYATGSVGVGILSPVAFGGGYRVVDVRGNTADGGVVRVGTSDSSIAADLFVGSAFGGAVLRTATSSYLTLQTNATNAVIIDNGQRVSVGTGTVTGPATLNIYSSPYTGGASASTKSNLAIYSEEAVARGAGGGIVFGGNYTGSVKYEFAEIRGVKVSNTPGTGYRNGNLVFYTTNSSGVSTENVRLGSSAGITVGATGGISLASSTTYGTIALNGTEGGIVNFYVNGSSRGYLMGQEAYGFYDLRMYIPTGISGGGVFSLVNNNGPDYGMQWDADSNQVVFGASGATAASSAIVSIVSTTKGFIPPRMTTTQRNAISSAADGLMIYNTTTNTYNVRENSAWHGLSGVCEIPFIIDGGGSTITTGIKGDLKIPFACTINSWDILCDQSGSIVIDIWKDTYANFPPVDADSITASAVPTVTTATKAQSSTLTGWTTAIAADDILRFNVDSVTSCQRVTLCLKVTKI